MELGVMVSIHEDTDITQAFANAREAGFARGQITSFIHGITAEEVRQIAIAAHQAEFYVDAVGCYMNPLRPNDASLTESDLMDWTTIATNMAMMNGVERIVCWGGTLSKTMGEPNLLNGEEDTFNKLFINLHAMLEQVRGLPVRIVLEPYTAHVLTDARACVKVAQQFPGGEVRVVLDAPNIIPAAEASSSDTRVQDYVTTVAPAVGLIHLKDISRDVDGHRVFLPSGQGTLAYGPYLRAIAQNVPEVPMILESISTVQSMRGAREFVESVLKEYRL